MGDDVDWHREDNCAVVLGRDAVQRLQVSQLEKIIYDSNYIYDSGGGGDDGAVVLSQDVDSVC